MRQVCDCGKLIDDSKLDNYVRFTTPDLDSFHGIFDGTRNGAGAVLIIFDDDKKWCSLACLCAAISNYASGNVE